jgi:FkbM family methyltransferase
MKNLGSVLRAKLKQIKPIRAVGNWYRIQWTLFALRKHRDFDVLRTRNRYTLSYNNRFGYKPDNLSVSFFFDYHRMLWQTEVNGQTILTPICPLWETIMELRGYLLAYQPAPGDVVIDAGASNGFITSVLAKLVGPTGRVICIEPDPASFQMLQETIRINGLMNCIILNCALSSQTGQAAFISAGGASRIAADNHTSKNLVRVETVSLPSVFERVQGLNFRQIKLIKLDIEGGEVNVLDDLLQVLQDNRQVVIEIAAYHLFQGRPTWRWIEERCRGQGDIAFKTTYPIHTTTILAHVENHLALDHMKRLPKCDEHATTA